MWSLIVLTLVITIIDALITNKILNYNKMKKYVIISLKVVVLITLIALAFSVMPGTTYLLGFCLGCLSLTWILLGGDKVVSGSKTLLYGWVYTYEWSSPIKKQKAYRMAYFGNIMLFLSIFSYGVISTHIEENSTKESIARYMSYTESSEYKQKQEVFKKQFVAAQKRARANN